MKVIVKGLAVVIVVVGVIVLATWWSVAKPLQTPEEALNIFYTYWGAEDMLIDPLILAGEKVVPFVIEDVRNKDMPRRRYAIAFLGNGSYTQSVPVLTYILKDETEKDVFRGEAILSIYKIDKRKGREFAELYKGRTDYLGRMTQEVFKDSDYANWKRSYFEALIGMHQ